MVCRSGILASTLAVALSLAQETPKRREVVVVTGTYEPVPLDEADRPVRLFDTRENQPLVANTLIDFLKLDSSLDVRQRAPNNVQTDLSIRGATFGQTLVLLNGMRLNDVQSGHHSMDIPVPLESLARIEVLKGSGSTLYGSDAVGGVVNFITRPPEASEFRLRTAVGNFGVNQQRGSMTVAKQKLTQQLSFSRDFSTGFRENRDYRNLALNSTTHLLTGLGATDIVLAHADRPFGADQFYGNFNSWERTKTWYTSLRQDLGERTEASFAFRRHTDLFVLYRDRPQVFTNRHAVESFQTAVRRWEPLGENVKLHYGVEGLRDAIVSNNLGTHTRARGSGYMALDVRALRRFSFTIGAREEVYASLDHQFSTSVSAGLWLSSRFKLRGSVSRAFRLPTFTDLYYHDPANRGTPDLRPEKAWSYEAGLEWNAGGRLRGELNVFQRREQDGIDFVRTSPTDIWRATNFQRLNFTGLEASLTMVAGQRQHLDFHYTALRGGQTALSGVFSRYVFNYPSHSGVFGWQAALPGVLARTRVGALQRFARDPYAVWDIYVAGTRGRVHPFVQLTNLTDTRYQEILGVAMPGRGVVVGLEFALVRPGK